MLVEKIKKTREKDKEVVKIIEEIKNAEVKTEVKALRGGEWETKGELMLKKGKVYMLRNKKLRLKVIWLHYNILVAEYGRRWKTTKLVTRNLSQNELITCL